MIETDIETGRTVTLEVGYQGTIGRRLRMETPPGTTALASGVAAETSGESPGRSASTEDFIGTMQEHTTVDLDPVVTPWIEQETVPPLR